MLMDSTPANKVLRSALSVVLATSLCPVGQAFANASEKQAERGKTEQSLENAKLSDAVELTGSNSAAVSPTSSSDVALVDWTADGTCEWRIGMDGCLTIRPSGNQQSGALSGTNKWLDYKDSITAMQIQGTVRADKPEGMFKDLSYVTSASLEGLDISQATSTASMFENFGAKQLPVLDLTVLDTSSVTSMTRMCYGAKAQTITLDGMNTHSVTDMSYMFSSGWANDLNLNSLDTTAVTTMGGMFSSFSGADSLNINSFKGNSLTTTTYMFSYSSFGSISFESMRSPNLNDMSLMFYRCNASSIDIAPLGKTVVTAMNSAFAGCGSLETLNTDGFYSRKSIDLSNLCNGDSSLETVNMPTLSPTPISSFGEAFKGCTALKNVDISGIAMPEWKERSISAYNNSFRGCNPPSIIKLGSRFHDYRNEQWNGKGYVWYEMHLPKATSDGTYTGKWVNTDTGDTYDVWPDNIAGTYYQQKRLTSDMVDFDASAETYTGQPITKAVSVEGLTEGEDYEVSYANNADAGTATATITGINACAGQSLAYNFTINKATPNYDALSDLSVLYGQLISSTDLPDGFSWQTTDEYFNKPGTNTYLLRFGNGNPNYEVVNDIPLKVITSYILTEDLLNVKTQSFTYSGKPNTLTFGNPCLAEGTDYTVAYTGNVNAGTAHLVITGIGNFAGQTVDVPFEIAKATPQVDRSMVLAAKYDQTLADVKLPEGYSWQLDPTTSVGEPGQHVFYATFTPADTTNYEAVHDIPVALNVKDNRISAAQFAVDTTDATYNGADQTKSVTSSSLKENVDYTVSYSDNRNAGTATITITGIGKYKGSLTYEFTINKAAPTYTAPIGVKATYGQQLSEVPLPQGFAWSNASDLVGDPGKRTYLATYTPNDTRNYSSISSIPVDVSVFRVIDASMFSMKQEKFACTGSAIEPTIDSLIVPQDSYAVTYRNNTQVGHASAVITGAGYYVGTCELGFDIYDPATMPIVDWTACGSCEWRIGPDGALTIRPQNGASYGTLDHWSSNEYAPWTNHGSQITSCTLEGAISAPTARGLFRDLARIEAIDLSRLNISSAQDMSFMFHNCNSLKAIDCSQLDTRNIQDMNQAFSCCYALDTIDLNALDLGNVTSMRGLFAYDNFSSIDLSEVKAPNVTNVSGMFFVCTNLISVDLSSLNTSNVTDMSSMFENCHALKAVVMPTTSLGEVTDFSRFLYRCESLTSFDFSSTQSWQACKLSSFFDGCTSLKTVNLTGLSTSIATDMNGFFDACDSLETITLDSGFWFEGATGARLCSLPTPSTTAGYTGKWVNSSNRAYNPNEIPSRTSDTYTAQKAIQADMFIVDLTGEAYNGKPHYKSIVSTLNPNEYSVTYSNNVNAGQATITIAGTGSMA